MNNVLQELAQKLGAEGLSRAFTGLYQRLSAFNNAVDPSGKILVDDTALARAVVGSVPEAVREPLLDALRAIRTGGMAVVDGKPLVPRVLLANPESIRILGAPLLGALKLGEALSTEQLADRLLSLRSGPPLDPPHRDELIQVVREQLASVDAFNPGNIPRMRRSAIDTGGHSTDTGTPSGSGGTGVIVSNVINPPSPEDIQKFIDLLSVSIFEVHWWGWSISMKHDTADRLANLILGGALPALVKALSAAFTVGGTLAVMVGAAASAVGGPFVLSLIVGGVYAGAALKLNNTPRGERWCSTWPFFIGSGLMSVPWAEGN